MWVPRNKRPPSSIGSSAAVWVRLRRWQVLAKKRSLRHWQQPIAIPYSIPLTPLGRLQHFETPRFYAGSTVNVAGRRSSWRINTGCQRMEFLAKSKG